MNTIEELMPKTVKASPTIFNEDFLLQSSAAVKLYHQYAASLPLIDYHNHLPPQEIAADKKFKNITEIWLKGDHYKWRAMRTLGVNENLITGEATDIEKFSAWASCVPKTIRNPLFHWTHMELKNPFGVVEYLEENNADYIYHYCNEQLQKPAFSSRSLLNHYNVEMVCTTDDPCDDLSSHKRILENGFSVKVLPGFRPDKIFNIQNKASFLQYISVLEGITGIKVRNFSTLLEALKSRIDYFHEAGCTIADHGLTVMPAQSTFYQEMDNEFEWFLLRKDAQHFSKPENFTGALLKELCKMYHAKGWVQQFHIGPIRNNNTRMFKKLGVDSGFDSIGDDLQAKQLSRFLNELDKTDQLAKTVIYNVNPSFNEVFASMIGNFNDGSVKGKVQFGSGWWFMDQLDGMEKQINTLSSIGVVSTFIGMLTDSRSFLSFPRHEYFRRLLCNIFGNEMEKGLLPNDVKWVGGIIQDISYYNAKAYFNL